MKTHEKLFTDLESGDYILGKGIVWLTHVEPHGVFDEDPSVWYFDINDSYYGVCVRCAELDEIFTVVDRKDPEYARVLQIRISHVVDSINHKESERAFLQALLSNFKW